jgi:hypothetical protein
MQFKTSAWVGIAIAFTLSAASEASAQVRPDQRIPVRKDVPARIDTVRVTRVDTVRTVVRDTVMVTRWDTVSAVRPLDIVALGNWYWGLVGGSTNPIYNLAIGQAAGYHAGLMFGWHPVGAAFGIQFDAAYHRVHENETTAGLSADARLAHLNGNLKIGVPWTMPGGLRAGMYLVGGPSLYHHRNLRWSTKGDRAAVRPYMLGDNPCGPPPPHPAGSPCVDRDKNMWDFGFNAGLGFVSGRLIAEARYQRIAGAGSRAFIPLSVGLIF